MAVQFALLALPLCILAFGLVDVNRATVAKQQLQDALDAATLMAARTTTATTDTALYNVGNPALTANLSTLSGVTLKTSSFHLNGVYIDSSATVQVTPVVANLWMSGNMNITATSQVVRTMDDLEVALVLDNTGSMASNLGSGGSKINALKSAASSLIDTLAAAAANSTDPNAVKYAVVPFSMTVNVGSTYQGQTWLTGVLPSSSGYGGLTHDVFATANTDRFTLLSQMGLTWGGCVESRPAPYDTQDTAPTTGTPDTLFVPFFAPDEPDANKASNGSGGYYSSQNNWITNDKTSSPSWVTRLGTVAKYASSNKSNITSTGKTAGHGPNEGCAIAPLQRLTTNATTAKNTLNSMVATGNTNVAMGLMWGWHVLSPNAPFADGVAYGTANHDKIVILLTDGDNTNDTYSNDYENAIYTGVGYIRQGRLVDTNGVALTTSSTSTDRMNAIDGRELATCANMKAKNIIIYSIGVGVSTHSQTLLQTCASGADHYYDVTDSSQLNTVFNAIAGSIQNLRLSK
ncbi:VWA domain-containing protein [Caulobacter sp. KR2-114]|uniref:VWA domain-containing protein n=1 Tax=Caulobacter sp. KR2-114 TaxID=3400912 RepID=UPI003C0419FD